MLPFIARQSYYTVSGNLVVCAEDFQKPALYKHATIMLLKEVVVFTAMDYLT